MSSYLVIDTCNLRRLIGKNEINKTLLQLKLWIEQKHVILLAPSTLLDEWEKHREEERGRILDGIKKWQEDMRKRKTIDHPSTHIQEEHYEDLKQKLFSQINIINDIINDYAVKIDITDKVREIVDKARLGNKAPFHKSKNNQKDAEILFSSAGYIVTQQKKSLTFISGNHKDFGISKENKDQLHPDIQEQFSAVTFEYCTDIYPWIQSQIKLGLPTYRQTARDARRIESLIRVNKSAPLLHQIYEYLTKRFRNINILPKKLFTEHYPFIESTHFNSYHRPFTLVTDNKELYELMTSLTVTPTKVISTIDGVIKSVEDENQARAIFHILAHNFLYHIAYKLDESVPLKYEDDQKVCHCDLCQYYAFRFDALVEKTAKDIEDLPLYDIENNMKVAYVQYKLHNYVAAGKIFHELYRRREQRDLIYYILAYNSKQLGWLISQTMWDDRSVIEWGKSLTEIDLNDIYKACRNVEDDPILKWLHQERFYQESLMKAYEHNHDIREVQQSRSNGYNTGTRKMQEVFLVNQAFLDRNCVVYDVYGMYQPMYELFTEGLISSLQWPAGMGGRLLHINDDLIKHIILSGKHDWLRKLYYRSRLENLPYNRTASSDRQLESITAYLLDTFPKFITKKQQAENDVRFSMFERTKEIVLAAVTMIATIDISAADLESIVKKFLHLLSHEKLSNDFHLSETLRFLLERKGGLLSEELIRQLILHSIGHKTLTRSEQMIDTVGHALEKTNRSLALTENEFQIVKEQLIDKLSGEHEEEPVYILSTLFSVLPENQQKVIGSAIASALTEKFDADRFYMAAMTEIINADQLLVEKYFQEIAEQSKLPARRHWFGTRQWYTDRDVDHFINFCFKFDLQIPKDLAGRIASLDKYYEWLIDPDQYDYVEFNVDWLSHHFTKHYKQWFRKSEKLKTHLWELIERNRMTDTYRTFSMIYAFKD